MKRALALALVTLALAGCKSASPSQYISPRITGRVLDARTQQPIEGVQVWRLTPPDPNVDPALKGGQVMQQQAAAVRTRSDGTFVLVSERNLAVFRRLGWYSVSLTLAHPSYERLTTEFTLANATNTASGEPLVRAGDIQLQPKSSNVPAAARAGKTTASERRNRKSNLAGKRHSTRDPIRFIQ